MSNDSNKRPIANDEIPYPSFRKIMFTQIDNKDTVVFLICKKAMCCLALIIEESETHAGLIRATINKIKKLTSFYIRCLYICVNTNIHITLNS